MPAELQTKINTLVSSWNSYGAYFLNARNHLYYAGDAIAAQNWTEAKAQLYNSADDFGSAIGFMLYAVPYYYCKLIPVLQWINDNWPTAATVDMASILLAMRGAKFDELQDFTAIEDAFRASLWNAPFNADYYAAFVRTFMKWP